MIMENLIPYGISWENLLDTEEIQRIHALANQHRPQTQQRGAIMHDGREDSKFRRSNIIWIPYNDTSAWIYKKIADRVRELNSKHYEFDLTGSLTLQYTEYDAAEQGEYTWHNDLIYNSFDSIRKLSASVLLSDTKDYTGGAFLFRPDGEAREIPQQQGNIIVFPSWIPHCVRPVLTGRRISLVLWFYGKKFK